MHEVGSTGWRKSRRSNASADCVEVNARPGHGLVGVRDSKRQGHGPVLEFGAPAWEAFLATVRDREAEL